MSDEDHHELDYDYTKAVKDGDVSEEIHGATHGVENMLTMLQFNPSVATCAALLEVAISGLVVLHEDRKQEAEYLIATMIDELYKLGKDSVISCVKKRKIIGKIVKESKIYALEKEMQDKKETGKKEKDDKDSLKGLSLGQRNKKNIINAAIDALEKKLLGKKTGGEVEPAIKVKEGKTNEAFIRENGCEIDPPIFPTEDFMALVYMTGEGKDSKLDIISSKEHMSKIAGGDNNGRWFFIRKEAISLQQ